MATYFVSKKQKIHTIHSHDYQEVIDGTPAASSLA